ncbi:MAG: uncharacterized protein K0S32_308 [Bacteroidetes bacterium]|jgi:hypothetical protein|nr:uncharacterized protein [Bacteroidota bacterium]
MKIFKFILGLLIVLLATGAFAQEEINENNCLNGDVVFIKKSGFHNQHGTDEKSKYNFAGIIFWENGYPIVYFSDEPLKKCALSDFIKSSEGKKYDIKRLIDPALLTNETINTMQVFATAKLGSAYDAKEALNNEEFYNAEFVWTIYKTCLGVYLCEPKENGTASADKKFIGHGLANKHVSVRDIYRSEILQ